jgi:hypothetical protein
MALTATSVVVRTGRGLSVAGTRVTLYQVMDFLKAGYLAALIRNRLNLSDEQMQGVIAYLEMHRTEVEAEYEQVLREAEANQNYWTERNRERLQKTKAASELDITALRAKLRAAKQAKLNRA